MKIESFIGAAIVAVVAAIATILIAGEVLDWAVDKLGSPENYLAFAPVAMLAPILLTGLAVSTLVGIPCGLLVPQRAFVVSALAVLPLVAFSFTTVMESDPADWWTPYVPAITVFGLVSIVANFVGFAMLAAKWRNKSK